MKIGIQSHGENGAHIFTNDSPELEYVGLSSYSLYQLSGIVMASGLLNLKATSRDVIFQTLMGESAYGTPKYLKFNKDTGGFSEVTIPNNRVKNLIEWHEYFNENPRYISSPTGGFTRAEASGHLIDISNSLSGCLTFLVSGTSIKVDYTLPENNGGCEKEFYTYINLHFTQRNNDNTNQIVQKFHAMAGIPNTPAGTKYSWTGTQKATSSKHIGVLAPVQDGGEDNTNNMIAAPIAKSYCSNTGRWEFGTQQTLVKLLTNVDPVQETALDAETFDNLSFEELSNPGSAFYLSNYKTGYASPIYPQNKNPNLAMPAFVTKSCDDKNTKEKIQVVNRSTRPYAIGETAKASFICGEWLLSPLSDPKPQVFTPVINRWRFQKFIVDSDSYFKNWVYYYYLDDDGKLEDGNEKKFSTYVSPALYETSITRMFFMDMAVDSTIFGPTHLNTVNSKTKIAKANLNATKSLETLRSWTNEEWDAYSIPDSATEINSGNIIVPSDRYWQSTVADQMGTWAGGNGPYNIIGRTNIAVNNNSSEEDKDNWAYKFNHFWGPVFNGGYNPSKIANINNGQVDFKTQRSNSTYFSNSSGTPINDNSEAKNIQYDSGRYMFADSSDGNWSQFPAELALLGGPNAKNGGPQDCFDIIKSGIGPALATSNCYNVMQKVMGINISGIPDRWDWLYIDDGNDDDPLVNDLYDLKPNSLELTFMPLSAEMVGSSDQFSRSLLQVTLGSRGDLNPSINILRRLYMTARGFSGNLDTIAGPEFGAGAFYRSKFPFLKETYWVTGTTASTLPHVWGTKFFPRENLASTSMKSYSGGMVTRANIIPYDYAVKQTAGHSAGSPGIWYASSLLNQDDDFRRVGGSNGNADCVGVICAKVSMSWNQSSIPIKISERFGLNGVGVTLTPTSTNIINVGIFGNTSGPSVGQSTRLTEPQWGSTIDNAQGLYSFATNALYARVFTQWPEKQTLFDGRYFGVLHFLPGALSGHSNIDSEIKDDDITYSGAWSPTVGRNSSNANQRTATLPQYERSVDKITYSVDFRIPTYAHPKTPASDNIICSAGTVVDRCGPDTRVLRPESEWRVNPIRRGQMFAVGANTQRVFRYFKRVIGVSKDVADWKYAYKVDSSGNAVTGASADDGRGKDYSVKDLIGITGGAGSSAQIEITSIGTSGAVTGFKIVDQGEGYVPANFKDTNWGSRTDRKEDPLTVLTSINIKVKNAKATGLKVGPIVGEVYDRLMEDKGPLEVAPMTRLSTPSAAGENNIIQTNRTTQILINASSGVKPNYDLFFHYHNDIGHTLSAWREWSVQKDNTNGLAQYCTINIG